CHNPRLIIELDGHSHGTAQAARHDAQRDAFLKARGYRVLRLSNADVVRDRDNVGWTIEAAIAELSPPSPLRGGAGGGGRTVSTGNELIELLQSGPTNAHPERGGGVPFAVVRYRELFAALPEKVQREVVARWGEAESDPFVRGAAFQLPV